MRLSVLATLFLAACPAPELCPDGSEPVDDECPYEGVDIPAPTEGRNWAILEGAQFPASPTGDTTKFKTVPIELTGFDYGLELGDVSIASTGGNLRVAIPVKNTGIITKCWVQIDDFDFLDASGNVVATEDLSFVTGSVHRRESGVLTDTCLDASQTGFFLDIVVGDIDEIASVALILDEPSTETFHGADVAIRPTSYSEPEPGKLAIEVSHVEGPTKDVQELMTYVVIGDDDVPVWWGFASTDSSAPMGPGDTRTYNELVTPPLAGSEIWAYVDFAD